jgi:aminoglycoside 6'-N-acetyltransferase
MEPLVSDSELALRPMVAGDFGTMARWLSDPRVLEWFGGRDRPMSYGDVRAKYRPRLAGEQPTVCVIAELAGKPIGYLQYYRWRDFPRDATALRLTTLDNPYGLDLFVGEPELWGTGTGTRMLRLLLRYLFGTLGVRRVALSTMTHNYRAQRAYAKAGFRKVRLVPAAEVHEGVARDEWVMVADRGSYRQALSSW